MFWIGLICGVLIGTLFGIVIASMTSAAADADRDDAEWHRRFGDQGNYIPRTGPSPTSPPPKPRK